MGAINTIPNIDIFFGGLSGKSRLILSRPAARGTGWRRWWGENGGAVAGIHLRKSESVEGGGGGGEGRGGEEMEGRAAACQ